MELHQIIGWGIILVWFLLGMWSIYKNPPALSATFATLPSMPSWPLRCSWRGTVKGASYPLSKRCPGRRSSWLRFGTGRVS